MNSKYLLRTISAVLLVIMLIPLMAACSEKVDTKVKVDNVFKSDYLTVPENFEPSGNIHYINDRIYIQGYERENYKNVVYSVNKDGTNGALIDLLKGNDNAYIYHMSITSDSAIIYLYNESYYDEETYAYTNTYYLAKRDLDDNLLMDINLNEIFAKSDEDYFYVYSFSIDANNNIYLTSNNILYILDENGNYLFNIEMPEESYINTLITTNKGDMILIYYDYSSGNYNMYAKTIDFNKKDLGDDFDFGDISNSYLYNTIKSNDEKYDFYYNDSSSVYGYNISNKTTKEIINWINSDIDTSYTNYFCVVSSDELICSGYNYLKEKYEIMLLERVPEEDIKEKYILTLAAFSLDYRIKAYVIEFNRNSLDYRIQIEDYYKYSTDDDYTIGVTKLNNDITAGKIPDILIINNYYMPVNSYSAKGIFADLNKFIESDPEINRSDYFENILDAAEYDGKLYQLFSGFYIQTVVGKTKFFGDMNGWTLSEFNQFMQSQPEGTIAFQSVTRSSMLEKYCTMLIDDFIDYNTGKCDFDSEGFIKVLEFCNSLDEKYYWEDPNYDWEKYWEFYENAYTEDRVVLMDYYLSGFDYFWDTVKVDFNDDVTFIGMPTESRNGSAIYTMGELSMSSNTKHPDAVWSFIRQFIMDDYLDTMSYGFPIKKSTVDKLADKAINPDTSNNYYYGVVEEVAVAEVAPAVPVVDDTEEEIEEDEKAPAVAEAPVAEERKNIRYINDEPVDIGFITREYTDKIIDLIENIDHIIRYDNDMIDIIKEEADEYFKGVKTATETAKIIQNRLQNYVDEKR